MITQNNKKLLGAYEQGGCIGCNYYLQISKTDGKHSTGFLGKLRSGFSGCSYALYSKGEKATKGKITADTRFTIASVDFETNFMGLKGPRKFEARIPNITSNQ